MGKHKQRQKNKDVNNIKNSNIYNDPDLPSAPRLEIYQETFGCLESITEQWYNTLFKIERKF